MGDGADEREDDGVITIKGERARKRTMVSARKKMQTTESIRKRMKGENLLMSFINYKTITNTILLSPTEYHLISLVVMLLYMIRKYSFRIECCWHRDKSCEMLIGR